MSVNKIKRKTYSTSETAEGRRESRASDRAASRMSENLYLTFLLESNSDLSSRSKESSDGEDENDISIV